MMRNKRLGLIAFALMISTCVFWSCEDESEQQTEKWTTVFYDDFGGENSDIATNYEVQIYGNGSAHIINNQLQVNDGDFYAIRYKTPVPDDKVRVSLQCTTEDAPSPDYAFGISVRSRSLAEGWTEQEIYMGTLWYGSDTISINKLVGSGFPTPLVRKGFNINPNTSYMLQLTYNEGMLTFKVTDLDSNIADSIEYTDPAPLTGDTISINGMQIDGDVVYFDDFKIEKIE